MYAMTRIQEFLSAEDGAVTTDWVVLAGLLVGIAFAALTTISNGVENMTQDTADAFAAIDPSEIPFGRLTSTP